MSIGNLTRLDPYSTRNKTSMQEPEQSPEDQISFLADELGVHEIVKILSGICRERAQQMRDRFGDDSMAKVWEDVGRELGEMIIPVA
jgi:hypothetical protein